jgi:hypothetical protein
MLAAIRGAIAGNRVELYLQRCADAAAAQTRY